MGHPATPQNFRRHMVAIDTRPFLAELSAHHDDWSISTGRQKIAVQRETNSIFLRGAHRTNPKLHVNDVQDCVTTQAAVHFPVAMAFLNYIAERQRAALQRAIIVRLQPHGNVYAHCDEGAYYRIRDRYHLVLSSPAGSVMTADSEMVLMQQGELWSFDNRILHTAENRSDEWRIHLIFDLLPAAKRLIYRDPNASSIDIARRSAA